MNRTFIGLGNGVILSRYSSFAPGKILRNVVGIAVVTAAAFAVLPSTMVTAATTVSVPASIDATGQVDVTAQLNSFIASLPGDTVVEFPTSGRYRVEGTLAIVDKGNLTIKGNGSTIFATSLGDRSRRHVYMHGGHDLTIRGLNVVGANPNAGLADLAYDSTRVGQHGFEVEGSDRVLLDGVSATDVFGDFVYMGRDVRNGRWSSNVTVMNSRFERNGRQGMSFTATRGARVINNTLTDIRMVTFDMEPNGASNWGVEDVLIEGNRVGSTRLNFISAHGHGPVNNVTVNRNTLTGEQMNISVYPEPGTRRSGWTITGNTSDYVGHGTRGLIAIERVDGLRVEGNYHALAASRDMPFVETWASCGLTVKGNTVPGALMELRDNGGYTCPASTSTTSSTSSTTAPSTTTTSTTTSTTSTTVPAAPIATEVVETASATINRGNPIWVYAPSATTGMLAAEVQYTKGRSLTLTVTDAAGKVLGTASGPSPLRVSDVPAAAGQRLLVHDLQGTSATSAVLTITVR